MYANVVDVRIEIDFDQALKGLHEEVVPQVKQTPGVVAGYWMSPLDKDDVGHSVIVFETEEQARAAAQMVQEGSTPMEGVTIVRVETREVVAHL
ncbi:MAG: hypothetical protein HOV87_07545 [Catenulispora sp.]|nr:hypothetical protein [Catenulispora sp.]